MRVLALDTTTAAGSAALVEDDRIVAERRGDESRTHGERLPGEILGLVESCGLGIDDVDAFAVAAGPGSFTGLRIGIATIQGLAFVGRRPVAAVSALEALAHAGSEAMPAGTIVAAWMDAHRHEVFTAAYRVSDRPLFDPERLAIVEEPRVGAAEATLERWADERMVMPSMFVGDGAVRYAAIVHRHAASAHVLVAPPLAGAIGRLGAIRLRSGRPAGPSAVRPLYVRRPDAELARDARR
ncbi:MAG: tRNA (adenosine(37)-N6)-threonylcarbamoyltransferase complex dimerization subunit type 1 TsaB [Betaproteobacteria bacterium]